MESKCKLTENLLASTVGACLTCIEIGVVIKSKVVVVKIYGGVIDGPFETASLSVQTTNVACVADIQWADGLE